MDTTTPAGQPIVLRDKSAPFLIRTFVKIGSFHRLSEFEEGILPIADEQQLFTWKDATLREVLTTLRNTAPNTTEYRHPLARFSFRAIYADSANRGRFSQKDLGMVYSRDILGEPGNLTTTAPRLLEDMDGENREPNEREKEERTLDELRFVPGDYLCVAVLLPKSATVAVGPGGEVALRPTAAGTGPTSTTNGWRNAAGAGARSGDGGWGSSVAPTGAPGPGRGGGHWRGDSSNPPPGPIGRRGRGGGRGGDFAGRDVDFDRVRDGDRRIPPPRRGGDSPPPRGSWGDRERGGRGGGGGRRSRTRSRSRTPPRRRNARHD